jgi:hypothetical protein
MAIGIMTLSISKYRIMAFSITIKNAILSIKTFSI